MKEYGWDWYTYQNQPTWVIELAIRKFSIEGKLAEQAAENTKSHA